MTCLNIQTLNSDQILNITKKRWAVAPHYTRPGSQRTHTWTNKPATQKRIEHFHIRLSTASMSFLGFRGLRTWKPSCLNWSDIYHGCYYVFALSVFAREWYLLQALSFTFLSVLVIKFNQFDHWFDQGEIAIYDWRNK